MIGRSLRGAGRQELPLLELREETRQQTPIPQRPFVVVKPRKIRKTFPLRDDDAQQGAMPRRGHDLEGLDDEIDEGTTFIAVELERRLPLMADHFLDDGAEQIVLGREVAVERRLRPARSVEDGF